MSGLILTFHFIICIFLIIVVLLQAGKGADIGATFGGGSQTVFGPRGAATLLSKVTTGAAILFLLTSVFLANMANEKSKNSVINGAKLPPPVVESQPAESQPESQKAEENIAKPEEKVTEAAAITESAPAESAPAKKAKKKR